MLDHGVADDDLGVGEGSFVHGEMFVGEGAGVEEQGVAGLGGGDDELVHDAAGGVDVVVFGALGEEGDLLDGERCSGEGEHGHGAGDFDGGGGAEAGAEGDVAGEVEIEGRGFDAALLQLTEHADGIVGPEAAGGGAVVAVEGEGVGKELAGEAVTTIGAGGDGGVGGEGDGHGEDEAAGVVGVLAEQVDAGGRDALDGPVRGVGSAGES